MYEIDWNAISAIANAIMATVAVVAAIFAYHQLTEAARSRLAQSSLQIVQRRQNTLTLYEKWDSAEFSQYRLISWDVWLDLKNARSKGVVDWLSGKHSELSSEESEYLFPKNRRIAVRSLMNYFVNVYEYNKLGLIDSSITDDLFREPWLWWSDFFRTLRMEVEEELKSPNRPENSAYNGRLQKTAFLDQMFSLRLSDSKPLLKHQN